MTSRSYLLYIAFALLAAHAAVLGWFGDVSPGPILSDLAQLLIGVLVFFACLQATRRSLVFGRLFWKLTAIAVFLWCIGQALGTYYGSYLNLPTKSLWHVDIFYVAWPAPLVMCLFLDTEEEQERTDWRRFLDFGQVAIVFVLIYFYFSNLQGVSGSAYRLSVAADGLVSAAFFARAFSLRDDPARKLFLGIGIFRLVAFLTDLYFALELPGHPNGAWFDLVWSVPFLIPLITAVSWSESPRPDSTRSQRSLRRPRLLLTHVLPLIFPVLVVVMAANIAPTQLKIAALAVLLSLATSYARLLLTHGDLRRSAAALRDHHELLNAIIEGTTAAIFVKDLQGRYLLINSAGSAFIGKNTAEILGKDDAAFFSSESARRIMARDSQTVASGVVQTYEEEATVEGVTRTYLSTKGPFRDAQGRVAGLVGSSLDITDRYRAIEALAESEKRFRAVFDGSPIGMALVGVDGTVLACNSSYRKTLGIGESEIFTTDLFDQLTHPDSREIDAARYAQVARGELDQIRLDKRYVLRDGRTVSADLHLRLMRGRQGEPKFVIGMAVDTTEQKHLEAQLLQSQRMETIGRLAGGVAHDFNNLLTVIRGYCDLVIDRTSNDPVAQNQLAHVDKATSQATSLTKQLLAFSRRQVLQPKVFDLNALVLDAGKMLQRLLDDNIQLLIHAVPGLGAVRADPSQIEQVILNLVINARDAMPDGGKITIETTNVELDGSYALEHLGAKPGSYVMMAVTDTGTGIDDQTIAHIFEPFFTTKELGKGTGLGLSMVYGIVKQSGGSIWVYSEENRGTTFKVYLPRADEPVQPLERDRAPAKVPIGDETILLVEDDPMVRELTAEVLRGNGYQLLEAATPSVALEICNRHSGPIQLLLTDVVMPEMNGGEMARLVQELRPDIRVLFISGYTDNAVLQNGQLHKGLAFLQKPFAPTTLGKKVREILDEKVRHTV